MSNDNEIKKLGNKQAEDVTGGRKSLLPKISIIKTRCDQCDKVIDGQSRFAIPVAKDKGTLCNECFEKQKAALGQEAANAVWLGIKSNAKPNQTESITNNKWN